MLESFTEADIKTIFEPKIKAIVEEQVIAKTNELLLLSKLGSERQNEQREDLGWALESLLARIERGMTVEIRLGLPKSDGAAGEKSDDDSKERVQFQTLESIKSQLSFPPPDPSPTLNLPPPEPPSKKADE